MSYTQTQYQHKKYETTLKHQPLLEIHSWDYPKSSTSSPLLVVEFSTHFVGQIKKKGGSTHTCDIDHGTTLKHHAPTISHLISICEQQYL